MVNYRIDPEPPILATVVDRLSSLGVPADKSHVAAAIAEITGEAADPQEVAKCCDYLTGLGPLGRIMTASDVTDVTILGDGKIWVEASGVTSQAVNKFTPNQVQTLARRFAAAAGAEVSVARPLGSGVLPGRIRLQIVGTQLVANGPIISLRRLSASSRRAESFFPAAAQPIVPDLLSLLLRSSYLVIGETGAGKTALLQALLAQQQPGERLISVEETPELLPAHPQHIALVSRPGVADGHTGIGGPELLRTSLRLRPDRLVVGEVRGGEVTDLLVASNTGHTVAATLHANSPPEVPERLTVLGAMANWAPVDMQRLWRIGIEYVLHVVKEGSRRTLSSIWEVGADYYRPLVQFGRRVRCTRPVAGVGS